MNTICFYDKNRNTVMSFSDFTFQKDVISDIIYFQINIDYVFFNVKTKIECEKNDFENIVKNIQNLYDGKKQSIVFSHLERQLFIKFDSLEFGQIKVTVELFQYIFYNNVCKAILQFEYETDQSFLPELIEEIKTAINLD